VTQNDCEMWRKAIETGMCVCGAGPFRSIAQHLSMVHGISRNELRDLAGLMRADSMCAPDYAEACAEREREKIAAGEAPVGARGNHPRGNRSYGPAGLAQVQERASAMARTTNVLGRVVRKCAPDCTCGRHRKRAA
jgi:hypothetical protein